MLLESKIAFQKVWKHFSIRERSEFLIQISEYLRGNKDFLAEHITDEMGKPYKESLAEIEKVAWLIDYHCENAEEFLKPKVIETEYSEVYIQYDPLGGILGIMPWNFPFWQVFRFAIPTLLAGNTVFLKHAPNVPQCALAIEKIFHRFLPDPYIFQNIFISVTQIENVLSHSFVQGVSLTGSERAGSSVAAVAGKHLKKCVLMTDPKN